MARVMITGVNGFVGKHMVRELVSRGCEVFGVGHEQSAHDSISDSLTAYATADLTDVMAVSQLSWEGVNAVISLAGMANVGASFSDPEKYKSVNVQVLSVLGEFLVTNKLGPRVIAVSSGVVYDHDQSLPLTESSSLTTNGSPYAESKILMEQAAQKLRAQGLPCVITRPLNHSGPGQLGGFLIPDLYQKIVAAQQADGVVKVGNLKTKRDYTDVRDVVRAYADLALASKAPKHDIYNVCSGKSIAGTAILDLLLATTNARDTIKVVQDKALLRPNDAPELYGSYERLQAETGWQPTIPLSQTVQDFVNSS